MEQTQSTVEHPFLSIIIPALNEAGRLPHALESLDAFLRQQTYTAEVIVVENGSTDDTVGVVQRFAQTHPYVRVIAGIARGKGRAIKRGMLEANGDYRFFADVDFSMPVEEIAKFLPPTLEGYDVALGSREARGAKRYNEPFHRHFMGRVNNSLIEMLALQGFQDTQCGFKCFTRKAAIDLFSVQHTNGIGFDVELLYIARKRGYKIVEVPVNWYYNADSRMRLVQDSLAMIREILEIRQNWKAGDYTAPAHKLSETSAEQSYTVSMT